MMPQGAGWYGWIVHFPASTQWPSAFAGRGMWQQCPSIRLNVLASKQKISIKEEVCGQIDNM